MARIKKRGLDYFPMNTDFMQSRIVRRIMKREGDGALATLLGVLSCIYSGEGYYVKADDSFYEDLSDTLFNQEEADVRRIVALAVEIGFFHAGLFAEQGILTSNDIQRQFLFCTKKRGSRLIDPCFSLLSEEDLAAIAASGKKTQTAKKCTESTRNANLSTEKADFTYFGTQSIAKQSIAQQSIEKKSKEQHSTAYGVDQTPLSDDARRKEEKERGDEFHQGPRAEPTETGSAGQAGIRPEVGERGRQGITAAYLQGIAPPNDGERRNLPGLLENLRLFQVPLNEQHVIILKSNFGLIGHPVWKGFCTLRESRGKIRFPGRYLLSLL